MASIAESAERFFLACETGKGWDGCKAYCTPNATFSAQAEPLADVRTLEQYCDWMRGLLGFVPDGRYELKSFAIDEKRRNVSAMPSSRVLIRVQADRARRQVRVSRPTTCMSCSLRTTGSHT